MFVGSRTFLTADPVAGGILDFPCGPSLHADFERNLDFERDLHEG